MLLIKISQIGDVPHTGLMNRWHRVFFLGEGQLYRRWGDSRDCTHPALTVE